jgi:hypothetical protein
MYAKLIEAATRGNGALYLGCGRVGFRRRGWRGGTDLHKLGRCLNQNGKYNWKRSVALGSALILCRLSLSP